jgi:flagellar basal body-associated protein FliL
MGTVDRTVRILIALVIGTLYLTGQIGGTVAIILGILAIVFLVTGLIGTCPLYMPFGLSTAQHQQEKPEQPEQPKDPGTD